MKQNQSQACLSSITRNQASNFAQLEGIQLSHTGRWMLLAEDETPPPSIPTQRRGRPRICTQQEHLEPLPGPGREKFRYLVICKCCEVSLFCNGDLVSGLDKRDRSDVPVPSSAGQLWGPGSITSPLHISSPSFVLNITTHVPPELSRG